MSESVHSWKWHQRVKRRSLRGWEIKVFCFQTARKESLWFLAAVDLRGWLKQSCSFCVTFGLHCHWNKEGRAQYENGLKNCNITQYAAKIIWHAFSGMLSRLASAVSRHIHLTFITLQHTCTYSMILIVQVLLFCLWIEWRCQDMPGSLSIISHVKKVVNFS